MKKNKFEKEILKGGDTTMANKYFEYPEEAKQSLSKAMKKAWTNDNIKVDTINGMIRTLKDNSSALLIVKEINNQFKMNYQNK